MNRRDTIKSLIASLFVGLWAKKVEAKPFNYDECEPDYRKWVEDFHEPTQWITTIKLDSTTIFTSKAVVAKENIRNLFNSAGESTPVSIDESFLVIYASNPGADCLRQVIEVTKLQDGSCIAQLGWRYDEIDKQDQSIVQAFAEQAMSDLQELEFVIG